MYEPGQTERASNLVSMFLFLVFNIFPDCSRLSVLGVNTEAFGLPLFEGHWPLREDSESEFLLFCIKTHSFKEIG